MKQPLLPQPYNLEFVGIDLKFVGISAKSVLPPANPRIYPWEATLRPHPMALAVGACLMSTPLPHSPNPPIFATTTTPLQALISTTRFHQP